MHKFSWLRLIRIGISVIILILTGMLFIVPANSMPSGFINTITWLQFAPSLLKFFIAAGLASAGFLLVIILTFLSGRIYCAGICPLGTIQDIFTWIHRRFFRAKPLKYAGATNYLRYTLLAFVLLSFFAGTTLLISLLDPYSNFGRIMSNLIRPLTFAGNNAISDILENIDIYLLAKSDYKGFFIMPFALSAAFLFVLGWLSWHRGRLFCNSVCPVGTVLGIISKVSYFRITLDRESCNNCGHCSSVCKAQCIDVKNREVDLSRCVACFNCLDVCPADGVSFKPVVLSKKIKPEAGSEGNAHRRKILKAVLLFSAFITSRALATRVTGGEKPTTIADTKKLVPSPPGSVSQEDFNRLCTSCHLCVSVCPTQVLQPSFLQYGLHGLMQPFMDNHSGFCNFECSLCGQVCPTGAIRPLSPERKKITQIGIARFIKENCVVYTDNTDCGACSEHCPTKAVNMILYKGKLTIPEVDDKICIGCGACEYACPTKPYRAIYVEGNEIHLIAEKPVEKELKPIESNQDFPF